MQLLEDLAGLLRGEYLVMATNAVQDAKWFSNDLTRLKLFVRRISLGRQVQGGTVYL